MGAADHRRRFHAPGFVYPSIGFALALAGLGLARVLPVRAAA